jgi:ketosteroid isomerase-like protein
MPASSFDLPSYRRIIMKAFTVSATLVHTGMTALAIFVLIHTPAANANNADVFLTKYISGLNAAMPPSGDAANVADLYAADGVQIHMLGEPTGSPQHGRKELRDFFSGLGNFWSDWTHVEKSRMTHGNSAVWEGIAQGHHRETGKPVTLPIVFFLEFDNDGAVREARIYVDGRSIGDQLK